MAYDFSKVVKVESGKILMSKGGLVVQMKKGEPEPVIELPPNTLRFRFSLPNTDPSSIVQTTQGQATWTKVEDSEYNDWDWHNENSLWNNYFFAGVFTSNLDPDVRVIDSNLDSVTDISLLFVECNSIKEVNLKNYGKVTKIDGFLSKTSLTEFEMDLDNITTMYASNTFDIPTNKKLILHNYHLEFWNNPINMDSIEYFELNGIDNMVQFNGLDRGSTPGNLQTLILKFKDISKVTNVDYLVQNNPYMKSGMLDLYNQFKDISNISHMNSFRWCGVDENGNYASEQARLERAQIPRSWGGDMPN